ncbi:hypothetical protein OEZ86_013270 [Tetradesmus obliquus]|nr:hypothetical protein OEZ86_013270 [Tetradesmus obliquus]
MCTAQASYTFSLPYVATVQTQGLSFPVTMWVDADSARMRVDVFGGLDSTLTLQDTSYLLYPRINVTVCDTIHDDVGPTVAGAAAGAALASARSLSQVLLGSAPLPDISDWLYGGATQIGNAPVHIWQRFDRQGGKTSTYTFYTTPQGTPVRLYMMGVNIIAYSHFDEYLVDFTRFEAGPIANADAVFAVPQQCKDASRQQQQQQQQQGAGGRGGAAGAGLLGTLAAMPWAHLPGRASPGLASTAQAAAAAQQLRRMAVRAANQRLVEAWNSAAASSSSSNGAAGRGFRLALNRFADWLPEEYAGLMTAKRSSSRSEAVKSLSLGEVSAPPGITKRHLPRHVDWRGTGADGQVKDQATCGSCWAFSAAGAMQGAWHAATGQSLSLSEQQLVDCSWEYGNNGCQGGEMEPAIQYVADAGGAAAEEDYQYRGQNMFCGSNATRPNFTPVAAFKGFAHVKKRDELALMWAVARHGPVAVSLDASQPDFKFYSEGVYSAPQCLTKKGELDHAVLVVGYGEERRGRKVVPYWLIKNSWSKYWGEDGYIRMLRTPGDGNDCGITSDPVLAVVAPQHVSAARRRAGYVPLAEQLRLSA